MLGLTIPRKKESLIVRMNAIKALTNILTTMDSDRNAIVPYVVIDNEQFDGGLEGGRERDVVGGAGAAGFVAEASGVVGRGGAHAGGQIGFHGTGACSGRSRLSTQTAGERVGEAGEAQVGNSRIPQAGDSPGESADDGDRPVEATRDIKENSMKITCSRIG